MSKDNVLAPRNPGIASEVSDILTQVLHDGAQQMLARAIEAEMRNFSNAIVLIEIKLGGHAGDRTPPQRE